MTRLVATVRHGRGTLARLATALNPHPVSGFDYQLGRDGTATLVVAVDGTVWDGQRVRLRLERLVDVLAVVEEPPASAGRVHPRRDGDVVVNTGASPR